MLLQGHAVPNVGRIDAALDGMRQLHASHPIAAWKVYTHAPGPGWSFMDDTGQAFLSTVEEIAATGGTRIVAVHKGISGGDPAASPVDIGPAAVAHPDLRFVVYHSGYEPANTEAAFAENGRGVDRLVRSLRDAGIRPGGNVYAELGSTWRAVMGDPDQAGHVLGKLLAAVGEDNVLWGTDSIWYGSPQDQIQAFRTFELTAEAQERFGYPALTPAVKQKIFGANAARLYGVDLAKVAASEVPGSRPTTSSTPVRRPRSGTRRTDRSARRPSPRRSAATIPGWSPANSPRCRTSQVRNAVSAVRYLAASPVAINSRAECIDSCGAPTSTVGIPRRAAVIGPIVDPHGRSPRCT